MDFLPLISNLFIVEKETASITRLGDILHWPQRHLVNHVSANYNNRVPTRVIVLKARQLGISTIVKGLEFSLAMLHDNFRARTVSHDNPSSEHLLSMLQTYYDHYQFRDFYAQVNRASNKRAWAPNNSLCTIQTAENAAGGRSSTIQFFHGSEVGFWGANAYGIMSGLGQALPTSWFSFAFLESTAQGLGNYFNTTWDLAVAGKNDYIPMFFPWQTHPEYVALDRVDPKSLDQEEYELSRAFAECRLGEENVEVLSRSMSSTDLDALRGPMPRDEILARLAWRRRKLRNDFQKEPERFLEEYPHRPSVAFLSTGRNLFPIANLEKVYRPKRPLTGDLASVAGRLRFTQSGFGKLKVYAPPRGDRHYIIGGDPTFSVRGDYATAQIIDRRTLEQVAVWRGKVDPGRFGQIMVELGYYYNTALLAPESNKDGATTIGRVLGLDYPNVYQRDAVDTLGQGSSNKYGWFTNQQTKHEMIGVLQSLVNDESATIHDLDTYTEMKNYVDLGLGKYGNANGSPNDDTVASFAIAMAVAMHTAIETEYLAQTARAESKALGRDINESQDLVVAGNGWEERSDDW